MDADTRKFLENIHSLAEDAISERRVFIDDGVSESLPSDHPLQQIRILVSERLKSKKHISKTVDKKIMEAARMRASGKNWEKVADIFGDSFVRDLGKGRRYNERFCIWSHVFKMSQRVDST